MASKNPLHTISIALIVLLLSACEQQPAVDTLRDEVSVLLERDFVPGLFELYSIRRMGSTPKRDPSTGDRRKTVYFNAELRFRKDYDLTAWDSLNAASLAFLLGATEKGLEGVSPGGNRKNDTLKVHGSKVFALRDGKWRPQSIPTQIRLQAGRESKVPQALARIAELSERAGKRYGGAEQDVIDKELTASLQRIERKLDQLGALLSVASGPPGGAYHRYIQVLEENASRTHFQVRNLATQGSVENCQLVQSDGVDLAIAQSNIAALALAGGGPFRQIGRQPDIRALSALFPEYLHVVVAQGADINNTAGLRGKRIDIGLTHSGSRVDALRLIQALGLKLPDFAEVRESGLEPAIDALIAGELDAFMTTLQAPGRALHNLLASGKATLLSLPPAVMDGLAKEHGVYRHAKIASRTYPNQRDDISTLSVTATLIVKADLPDERARQILDQLFKSASTLSREHLRLALLSRQTAQEGITIPFHPAAQTYLEGDSAAQQSVPIVQDAGKSP